MRSKGVAAIAGLALLALPLLVIGGEEPADPVLEGLVTELDRTLENLGRQPEVPYFLAYEIVDTDRAEVESVFGALDTSNRRQSRLLDIDLRVGSPSLDNTHPIRGSGWSAPRQRSGGYTVPIEGDPAALRAALWRHTDAAYRQGVEQLTRLRTNTQVKVEEEDPSDDFAHAPAVELFEEPATLAIDLEAWEPRVRGWTASFASHGDIYEARASLVATATTRWYVNSEGTRIRDSATLWRIMLRAFTKADDGMHLPRYESWTAHSLDALPDDGEILAAADRMIAELEALREAPVVEPFTGPAILGGRAAGVWFHEIFGHRVEGHRQKDEDEGQTFKKKVGERILPEGFDVFFDPSLQRSGDVDLVGHYQFDNEGVAGQRVDVIADGVFRGFLMSRSPIEGFPISNGHGRRSPGRNVVARQSNLVVEVADPVPAARLERMLIDEIQRQGKPFGLIFEDIQGGFTMTGRGFPNTFNVLPTVVYRLFPDGEKELVRGVDLIGTPLAAFEAVLAADDDVSVFNGVCGAESGWVPVSASAPALLLSTVEVQKKIKSKERGPILDAPVDPGGDS